MSSQWMLSKRGRMIDLTKMSSDRLRFHMSKQRGGGGASTRGSHALATAGSCEVKWYYTRYLNLQPRAARYYLDFGTLTHTTLAYFYAPQMERKPQWFLDHPDGEAAMKEDSLGNAKWYSDATGILDAYKHFAPAWKPIYCEEEFQTTVGTIDPNGQNEDPIHLESEGIEGEIVTLDLPALNDEIISCRPDLIVERNGYNWIVDHKTAGAAKNGSGRLPVIDETKPDFTYYWQAMLNLWVVRQHLEIEGFIFNRMKRTPPYDFSQDVFTIPLEQYQKIPRTVRDLVRRERALRVKAFKGESMLPHPWECRGQFGDCEFARLCHTDSEDERLLIQAMEFLPPEIKAA